MEKARIAANDFSKCEPHNTNDEDIIRMLGWMYPE